MFFLPTKRLKACPKHAKLVYESSFYLLTSYEKERERL